MLSRSVFLATASEDGSSEDCSSDDDEYKLTGQEEDRGEQSLNFNDVVQKEREFLACCRTERAIKNGSLEKDIPRFSVCFSGGGVRAAAFEAGTLWSLAESGALKGCEYLAACSGGSYIASAFASHLHYAKESEPPPTGGCLDRWYRLVVAKTICRMQRNIGYLLRDCLKSNDTGTSDGSGCLPRVCDLPILLAYFIFTILFNPIMFFLYYALPITELINVMFGFRMRMALCNIRNPNNSVKDFLRKELHSSYSHAVIKPFFALLLTTAILNLLCWLAAKYARPAWLAIRIYAKNASEMLLRLSFFLFLILAFLAIAFTLEAGSRHGQLGSCEEYLKYIMSSSESQTVTRCIDRMGLAFCPMASNCTLCVGSSSCPHWCGLNSERDPEPVVRPFTEAGLNSIGAFLIICVLAAVLLKPFFDDIFQRLLLKLGPIIQFMILMCMGAYRIFGPLTQQPVPVIFSFPFDSKMWDSTVEWSLLVAALLLPCYQFLESSAHIYYRRSLRQAFFDRGEDRKMGELVLNPFCPCMLCTGTVNDYHNPDYIAPTSEIFFSPLFSGGAKIGYVRTPGWVSLAKCMGLSGAASDAAALSSQSRYDLRRWWLDLTNLKMGSLMFFERRQGILARMGKLAIAWLRKKGFRDPYIDERFHRIADRLPSILLEECTIILMLVGLKAMKSQNTCELGRTVFGIAVCLLLGIFVLSFFAFLRCLEFTKYSSIVSRMHLATGHAHESHIPPRHIYVTDGGVMDALGLLQLLRRRCQRILVVDCTADPNEQFVHLLRTLQIAEAERLGSFFVASDPELALHTLLDEYRSDSDMNYVHLGVRYDSHICKKNPVQKEIGHLFVVKPRLSEHLRSSPATLKLLTQGEICGDQDSQDEDEEDDVDLSQSQLGGCWCSCCHRNGCNYNGGHEFPHIPNANQNITPELFSSLCRLGHELSKGAVDALCKCSVSNGICSVAAAQTFETSREDLRRAEVARASLPSGFV